MKTKKIFAIALVAMLILVGAYFVIAQSKQTSIIPCSSCGNDCTAESNCGNPTCGALNGGVCTCKNASCESCGGNCGSSSCSAVTGGTCDCGK